MKQFATPFHFTKPALLSVRGVDCHCQPGTLLSVRHVLGWHDPAISREASHPYFPSVRFENLIYIRPGLPVKTTTLLCFSSLNTH
jgi:hypothetical protein